MIRDRPGGSFSSLNCSPWWNRTGGVDRSTSRTNPGLGTGALFLITEVEGDLHRASGTGCRGVGDGVGEAGEGIGGGHEAAEVGGLDELEGQVEGAGPARLTAGVAGEVDDDLGAVGVGAGKGDLPLPEPGEVDVHVTGHAHHRDATLGAHD